MSNKTKIILGILIIALIAVVVYGITSNKKVDTKPEKKQDSIESMLTYYDETKNTVNNTVNNTVGENEISNKEQNNNENINSNIVIGKEEQESNNENNAAKNEQKAIELAQKEWGLSTSAYDFEAVLNNDGTYTVTVRNKTNTHSITSYTVNITTNTVTEN